MITDPAAIGPPVTKPGRAGTRWMGASVFVLGVVCYANTVRGEFVFDDLKLIVNNDIVKDPSHIWEIFFTNLWGLLGRGSNYYRPLPPLLFMGLHAMFGMRPEPFHVVSIALHAGTSCLVFLTARELLDQAGVGTVRARWSAFAAGVVFAVHPVHTEAVAWISGVMDVSCTFFSLLAIYAHVTRDTRGRAVLREAISLASLLLALFSKEPAAVVPLTLVAYDWLFNRPRIGNIGGAVRRWGPLFAVLAAYLCLRAYALGGVAPFRHGEEGTVLEVLLTLPRLLALYLEKLVLPVGLNVVHDIELIATPISPAFLASVVIIAFSVILCWLALRSGPVAAFGVVLFVLPLAPSLYLPALSQDVSKAFAERYLYFPSVGAALLLAAGLTALGNRSVRAYQAGLAALALMAIVFSGMTLSRNTAWRDGLALWSDCVKKSPNLPLARENLGLALIRRGKVAEGTRELQVALRLAPDLARNAVDSGIRVASKGLLLQAILSFQTALLYDPDLVEARYNLALAFEQLGWKAQAIQEYRATLSRDPNHPDAHNNLGVLLAQLNRLDDAIDHFKTAVQSRPADPELRLNLARAYDLKGLAREAAEQRALAAATGTRPLK